jgi:glycine hydroxymethyltransferase
MRLSEQVENIQTLVGNHTTWRQQCLNLIASENFASEFSRQFLSCDLTNRYGTYLLDPADREYRGNRFVISLENQVQKMACELFGAEFADVRPLGGQMAGVAVIMALTKPADTVYEVNVKDWGHGLVQGLLSSRLTKSLLDLRFLPMDPETRTVDLVQLGSAFDYAIPSLVVLGGSGMIFSEPVEEIVAMARRVGAKVAFDASHVLGLVGGKVFPNPLDQGVDLMFGSTHKTFFGPQGGILLSRDKEIFQAVVQSLYPALLTSHHLNRLPALAVALAEMAEFGETYAAQVVANSVRLATALAEKGFSVLGASKGFTRTHIVLLDVSSLGPSPRIALKLEQMNIITCSDFGGLAQGVSEARGCELRLGTAEVTRCGMKESEMEEIADILCAACFDDESPERIQGRVAKLAGGFTTARFSMDQKD